MPSSPVTVTVSVSVSVTVSVPASKRPSARSNRAFFNTLLAGRRRELALELLGELRERLLQTLAQLLHVGVLRQPGRNHQPPQHAVRARAREQPAHHDPDPAAGVRRMDEEPPRRAAERDEQDTA